MAITLVNKATLTPSGSSGGTTGAIDTTGANCFVAIAASWGSTGQPDVGDNLNAGFYTRIVDKDDGSSFRVSIYVKLDPTVGASQTFSFSPSFGTPYCSGTVLAFSGVDTVVGVDQISAGGGNTGSTTVQTGSLTPSGNGAIIVAGLGVNGGTAPPSIDSGYTLEAQVPFSGGNYYGHGAFDLIQSNAAAVNPTITYGGTPAGLCAVQISLLPAAISMAVAITEGADSVAASLNSTFGVSVAITEGADSVAASLNSTFNTAIAITESPDSVSASLATTIVLAAAITESPDSIFAQMGYNIIIRIGSEDADSVSLTLVNNGSWADCAAVDGDWTECPDPATTWTTCTNSTTDWTVN